MLSEQRRQQTSTAFLLSAQENDVLESERIASHRRPCEVNENDASFSGKRRGIEAKSPMKTHSDEARKLIAVSERNDEKASGGEKKTLGLCSVTRPTL